MQIIDGGNPRNSCSPHSCCSSLETLCTEYLAEAESLARGPTILYVPDGQPYRAVKTCEYIARGTLGTVTVGAFALAAGYGYEAYLLSSDTTLANPAVLAPDVVTFALSALYTAIAGVGAAALSAVLARSTVRRLSERPHQDASPK